MKRVITLALAALVSAPVLSYALGGWAVVTVDDVPDFLSTGANTVSFTVRAHGMTPMNDLSATVEARSGNHRTQVAAIRGKTPGQYVATLRIATPGEWNVVVKTGFVGVQATMLPTRAIEGAKIGSETPLTEVERGRRLFVAKGCITCHVNANARSENATVPAGPELTTKRFAVDYLRLYLADPSIRPPTNSGNRMPNLGLKPAEITSLVAFINGGNQVASR